MCPFCITTIGLIVAGAVSTGGVAALVLKECERKSDPAQGIPNSNQRSSHHAD